MVSEDDNEDKSKREVAKLFQEHLPRLLFCSALSCFVS